LQYRFFSHRVILYVKIITGISKFCCFHVILFFLQLFFLLQRGLLWFGEPELYAAGLGDDHGGERDGLRLHGPGSTAGEPQNT